MPYTQQWKATRNEQGEHCCCCCHFYQWGNIYRKKCHRADTNRDNNTNRWDILQPGATEPWNQTTSSPLKLKSISLRRLLCRQTGKSEFAFRYRAGLGVWFTDRALATCTKPWVWYQHCKEVKQNHQHHHHHLLQICSGSEKMLCSTQCTGPSFFFTYNLETVLQRKRFSLLKR